MSQQKIRNSQLEAALESVVAGTNVTVDITDPRNPVISASGGGGGGISAPVEIVTTDTVPDPDARDLGWLIWITDSATLYVLDFINGANTWRGIGGSAGGNKFGSAKLGSAKFA